MNATRQLSPSRAGRFLVILGALLGVFAIHGLSFNHSPSAEAAPTPVTQFVGSPERLHAIAEGLEKIAMVAPSALPDDSVDPHVLPCIGVVAGSLLLLAGLALRRQFGWDSVLRHGRVTGRWAVGLRLDAAAPLLTKLCVLRT